MEATTVKPTNKAGPKAVAVEPDIPEHTMTPLLPGSMSFAEFTIVHRSISPKAGTPFEDVLDPKYWVHVAKELKPTEQITVNPEDGAYWAELLVVNTNTGEAKVKVINHLDLEAEASVGGIEYEGYSVKWAGRAKFRVIHEDGTVIQSGFTNKAEAEIALINHVRNKRN